MNLRSDPKIQGEYAWMTMAAGIITYDVIAVMTKRAETMSSAIWRSLAHPIKSPVAVGVWLGLTWHLFGNPKARESYRTHGSHIRKITNRIETKLGTTS